MNIKQLKANFQLAELRYNSDKSEANTTILKLAQKEYEEALKPSKSEAIFEKAQKQGKEQLEVIKSIQESISPKKKSPKIEQLSGENKNPEPLAGTEENGDASGNLPEDTDTSGDTGSDGEKKTEVNP